MSTPLLLGLGWNPSGCIRVFVPNSGVPFASLITSADSGSRSKGEENEILRSKSPSEAPPRRW